MPDTTGITSTVPLEIIFAAGLVPVDLNNVFVAGEDPERALLAAERNGFPKNTCAWIKGMYGVLAGSEVTRVIGVTQGDCSNTHALLEILSTEGIEVIHFNYPYDRDAGKLEAEMTALAGRLGTELPAAAALQEKLLPVRRNLRELDRLTFEEGRVTGFENHLWLISSSDMGGNYEKFSAELEDFLASVRKRKEAADGIRLGVAGIPPIVPDFYSHVEKFGGRVVFNEMQRQFSMPGFENDLIGQYLAYTYPYDVFGRIDDIAREVERRRIKGLIHYVQSFCFRQIQDRLLRERLDVPVLTFECDRPAPLEGRSLTRLESFMEMLR